MSPSTAAGAIVGVVHASAGGVYDVFVDGMGMIQASMRGRLKKDARAGSRVVIGDRVSVSADEDAWTIHAVQNRDTELVRRGRHGRAPKVLAANLDTVFTIVSLSDPPASLELIDRLLVLVESSGMSPTLVLNKIDLEGARDRAESLTQQYRDIGYETHVTSAVTGDGLAAFRAEVCSSCSALIGPSGVGKSSLLNALDPGLHLRVGALSGKTGTGRHTTVGSRMIRLECGGLVADTPGFGDVGLWSVDAEDVADCFPDLAAHVEGCRFRRCTHVHEPGCGVLGALARGEVLESRYESYRALRTESEELERY